MKKIYLALLFAAGLLTTSCDMDKTPYGSLDDETAIQNVNDCFRFRNGLYGSMRGLTTGSYVYNSDLQVDLFHGTIENGNRGGEFSNALIYSSSGDIKAYWSGLYSVINSANYLLEKMEGLYATGQFSDSDMASLKRYEAEARFVRAYCYYWLADHYCQTYSADKAQQAGLGLPIVTAYYPTGDYSKYPGRSSMNDTWGFIETELQAAYDGLIAFEKIDGSSVAPESPYLSSYAVLALQSRIALLKGENDKALSKAEEVIKSGKYPLVEMDKYEEMWTKDTGTEIIFRPYMDNTELGNSTGVTYLGYNGDNADYIPTFEVLNMYDEGDVRFEAYFDIWEVTASKVKAYVFKKYPGNESLKTGEQPNYVNMSKPFRTSELYLIAAEAAAAKGDAPTANKYLNDLCAKRIKDYKAGNYTGQALVNAIRLERKKELLGEGYRLSDLRRWGIGFQRYADHPENPAINDIVVKLGVSMKYEAGDYRFVWPIPSDEMQNNPQMAGQQNPGY